jgi:DNA polymerase III epsilon subunit-like protein
MTQRYPLVCIDTETTGLKAGFHEIFEIAMVRIDDDFNLTNDYLHEFITIEHPDRFSLDAQRVTGKTAKDLMNLTPRHIVVEKIKNWIKDISVNGIIEPFGQNYYSFDNKFIKVLMGEESNNSVYDLMFTKENIDLRWKTKEFNNWIDQVNRKRIITEGRKYRTMVNQKMETVAEYCGVINHNAHTALSDVKTTVQCYKKLNDFMEKNKHLLLS